jgi:hypothetical protein
LLELHLISYIHARAELSDELRQVVMIGEQGPVR